MVDAEFGGLGTYLISAELRWRIAAIASMRRLAEKLAETSTKNAGDATTWWLKMPMLWVADVVRATARMDQMAIKPCGRVQESGERELYVPFLRKCIAACVGFQGCRMQKEDAREGAILGVSAGGMAPSVAALMG